MNDWSFTVRGIKKLKGKKVIFHRGKKMVTRQIDAMINFPTFQRVP